MNQSTVYLYGGYENQREPSSSLHFFNLGSGEVREIEKKGTWPLERASISSVDFRDSFVVFGGFGQKSYLNDLWLFNFTTMQWKELCNGSDSSSPPAQTLYSMTLAEIENEASVILFGGQRLINFERFYYHEIYAFSLVRGKWRVLSQNFAFSKSRCLKYGSSASMIAQRMIVFGGKRTEPEALFNEVLAMNISSLEWSLLNAGDSGLWNNTKQSFSPCAPPAKYNIGSLVMEQDLVIFDGSQFQGHFGLVWRFSTGLIPQTTFHVFSNFFF